LLLRHQVFDVDPSHAGWLALWLHPFERAPPRVGDPHARDLDPASVTADRHALAVRSREPSATRSIVRSKSHAPVRSPRCSRRGRRRAIRALRRGWLARVATRRARAQARYSGESCHACLHGVPFGLQSRAEFAREAIAKEIQRRLAHPPRERLEQEKLRRILRRSIAAQQPL